MMTIEDLSRQGWKFDYQSETGFVSAAHEKGGAITVCELRPSMQVDMHDLGNIIAHSLNSWGASKEVQS
jgi:hypothetical protein